MYHLSNKPEILPLVFVDHEIMRLIFLPVVLFGRSGKIYSRLGTMCYMFNQNRLPIDCFWIIIRDNMGDIRVLLFHLAIQH
jgi:hypothetical protein